MSNIFDVMDVEDKLGVTFQNKALLRTAFTHSSYANERKTQSNENLEFLGDSILNFIVADYLYHKYPNRPEGELSKMRAAVVSAEPLFHAIEKLDIGGHVYLGVGETKCKSGHANISADLFEAIVAAIYLDSDLDAARMFVLFALKDQLTEKTQADTVPVDAKTKLQEYAQRAKGNQLRYELVERKGPDHSPEFLFAAVLNDKVVGRGVGKSKRDAQQQAAADALKKLK